MRALREAHRETQTVGENEDRQGARGEGERGIQCCVHILHFKCSTISGVGFAPSTCRVFTYISLTVCAAEDQIDTSHTHRRTHRRTHRHTCLMDELAEDCACSNQCRPSCACPTALPCPPAPQGNHTPCSIWLYSLPIPQFPPYIPHRGTVGVDRLPGM